MNVLLVANDFAPSEALGEVKKALDNNLAFLNSGKKPEYELNEITHATAMADVILVGVSSTPALAEVEILALQGATKNSVPFGMYADTFFCHRRNGFEPYRDSASFLFVLNEFEAQDAKKYFPNTLIVPSGNPMWESFSYPTLTKNESRELLEIDDVQQVALIPGTKSEEVNSHLIKTAVDAVKQTSKKITLLFAPHPGDNTHPNKYISLFEHARSNGIIAKIVIPKVLLQKPGWQELYANADNTSEFTHNALLTSAQIVPTLSNCGGIIVQSASTLGIEAGFQQIPVVNFFSELALDRIADATGGERVWPPTICGAEAVLYEGKHDARDLANLIDNLLTKDGSSAMLQAQTKAYPKPNKRGMAVETIVETLMKFAKYPNN